MNGLLDDVVTMNMTMEAGIRNELRHHEQAESAPVEEEDHLRRTVEVVGAGFPVEVQSDEVYRLGVVTFPVVPATAIEERRTQDNH